MNFTTPIQRNEWINNWIKTNKAVITMYNFKNNTTKTVKKIENAYDLIFPKYNSDRYHKKETHPEYEMNISIIDTSWYSETISLDVSKEIVNLILNIKY